MDCCTLSLGPLSSIILVMDSLLLGLEELVHSGKASPAGVCTEVSKVFRVRPTDVGLLWLDGGSLSFLYPVELQAAGTIPISSSAVAARTASDRQPELFNQFPKVPHHTIFERIHLASGKPLVEMPDPIQKLMSAPIVSPDEALLGVIQVCRKGMTPGIAGADFSDEDLGLLVIAAGMIALTADSLLIPRNSANPSLRFHSSKSNLAKKRATA